MTTSGGDGRFPGAFPTVFPIMYLQAQHIDRAYCDKHFTSDAYLQTHSLHITRWQHLLALIVNFGENDAANVSAVEHDSGNLSKLKSQPIQQGILTMRRTIAITVLASIFCGGVAHSEIPSREPDELRRDANFIIEGKVRAVYSKTEESKNWLHTDYVAEISVMNVEKGKEFSVGKVVYAHYRTTKWIGKGDADPHSSGHGGVKKGEHIRAYLKSKNGSFHVLIPNGFAKLK